MAEQICVQKVGDITLSMQLAQGFSNHAEVALFVEGAAEPVVILNISENTRRGMIVIKPITTNIVRVKVAAKAEPGGPVSKAPSLADVRKA